MKIKLWGGFHNVAPFNIQARVIPDGDGLTAWISHGQHQRITRKMCGRRYCECGGARRAATDLPPDWRRCTLVDSGGHDIMIAYRDPLPGHQGVES